MQTAIKLTLFGDPADFAIEAGVEPDLPLPAAVFGRMRVWCGGCPLGDIDEHYCALYPAYVPFNWLTKNLRKLWHENLDGLSDRDAWNFLDGRLYGYHGDVKLDDDATTLEQAQMDAQRYGSFSFLTNWGEQFDRCKAFLLCPPGRPVRILSRSFPPVVGLGVDVSREGFVAAATAFARWFEAQQVRLNTPRPPYATTEDHI